MELQLSGWPFTLGKYTSHPMKRDKILMGSPSSDRVEFFMKLRCTILIVFFLLTVAPAYAAVAPAPHEITFTNDCSRQVGIVFDESNYDQSTSHLPSCKPRQTDPPLCWDGTQCGGEGCCPGIAETNNEPYNCPGIKHKGANCPNATPVKSGYENPAIGKSPVTACTGPVLGASVNGSIMLNAGQSRTITFPTYWNGAFYTRTDCTFDTDGYGSCLTGDCTKYGWGYRECAGAPSLPPATKGEFNFDIPAGGSKDWYDVSYVNGFNIAMVIEPTRYDPAYPGSDPASASRQCTAAGCAVGLADFHSPEVPSWNVLKYPGTTKFLAINDDCDVYTSYRGTSKWNQAVEDGYCCPAAAGYVNDSSHCHDKGVGSPCKICAGQNTNMYPFTLAGALPNSAKIYYNTCPKAYAYTYNDTDALFTCKGNTSFPSSYSVTLSCPAGSASLPSLAAQPTLTQYVPSDSSSEEPVSAAVLSPGGSGREPLTFIFNDYSQSGGSSAVSDTTIHHIHVNTTEKTGEILLKVTKSPDLGTVPGLTGHSFAIYYRIESPHLQSSQVGSALVEFSVKENPLTSWGLKPEDIVLMHWDGTRWMELPTVFDYSSNGRAYFSATTPGFSYFVITSKGALQVPAISTTLPLTVLPSMITVPGIVTTSPVTRDTAGVTAVPEITEDPVCQVNQSPASLSAETMPGIPALAAGVILAGCLAIGGGWYARRWWIRRQNPALFGNID
jgi:PGF-pre-PGF domain-containing protein